MHMYVYHYIVQFEFIIEQTSYISFAIFDYNINVYAFYLTQKRILNTFKLEK